MSYEGDKANEARLEKNKKWVFAATFTNYAMAHWTRKCYTNVKAEFIAAGISPLTLAAMDSGFMFTYAGGSFVTGMLGDRFSPVAVIAAGLLGSTLCLAMMVTGSYPFIAQQATIAGGYFLVTQLIHGGMQATGGPVNTAIMGNWWPKKGRGLIFGLWTCHQYTGDLVAAFFAAWILSTSINWRWAIIVPAVVNGLWSIINFTFVPATPESIGIETDKSRKAAAAGQDEIESVPIGFIQAFMLPNVLNYALAFGFFKLVNYAMFFQLPLILTSHFDPKTANLISALYSVGMMPGGIVCGWVSDIYGGRRACVIATFMAILFPLLWVLGMFMNTLPVVWLLALLLLMGCLVGGPNNIITSAVAADLAEDPSLQGNARSLGTVTGIINGSGSVTAAVGQLLIPIFYDWGKQNDVGYRYVWFFLMLCTVLGTSLMATKIVKELRQRTTGPEETALTGGGRAGYQAVPDSRV